MDDFKEAMDIRSDCFVSGSLAAVLRLSRFVGVAPLHFVKKRTGWRISRSRGWSIYGYVMITVCRRITGNEQSIMSLLSVLCTTAALVSEMQMDLNKSAHMWTKTRRVVCIVKDCLTVIVAAITVYEASGQMQSMITYLNRVEEINSELNIDHSSIHSSASEKKKFGLFIFWMTAAVTISLADFVLTTLLPNLLNPPMNLSVFYAGCVCSYYSLELRVIQFFMITLHVKDSFKTINDRLRSFMQDTVTNLERCSSFETVRHLAIEYFSLCNVARDVDQSHGLILLMMLGYLLLHLVSTPYYFLTFLFADINSQSSTMHVMNVMVQLCWCLLHTFNLVMIIEPCHLTHVEMEETRILVSHLMRSTRSINGPLSMELEMFFSHLILNDFYYKPLNMTTMSRALVVKILGSITTYLVIIIQL